MQTIGVVGSGSLLPGVVSLRQSHNEIIVFILFFYYACFRISPGPFPLIVLLHRGGHGEAAPYGMGCSQRSPTTDFLKACWAVYSIDHRLGRRPSRGPLAFVRSPTAPNRGNILRGVERRRVLYSG